MNSETKLYMFTDFWISLKFKNFLLVDVEKYVTDFRSVTLYINRLHFLFASKVFENKFELLVRKVKMNTTCRYSKVIGQ